MYHIFPSSAETGIVSAPPLSIYQRQTAEEREIHFSTLFRKSYPFSKKLFPLRSEVRQSLQYSTEKPDIPGKCIILHRFHRFMQLGKQSKPLPCPGSTCIMTAEYPQRPGNDMPAIQSRCRHPQKIIMTGGNFRLRLFYCPQQRAGIGSNFSRSFPVRAISCPAAGTRRQQ